MTKKEWNDKTIEISDALEEEARHKYEADMRAAEAYRDGYIQALLDYSKRMGGIQEATDTGPVWGCSGM